MVDVPDITVLYATIHRELLRYLQVLYHNIDVIVLVAAIDASFEFIGAIIAAISAMMMVARGLLRHVESHSSHHGALVELLTHEETCTSIRV